MNYSEKFLNLLKQDDIRYLLQDKKFDQLYKEIGRDESLIPQFTDFCYEVLRVDPLHYMNYIPNHFLKGSLITDFTIPNNITTIRYGAFKNCKSLTSVTIPNSVAGMGVGAFDGCNSLTKVNYLGTIDDWVQIGFSDLSSNPTCFAKNLYINNELVTSAEINKATEIGHYAFFCCSSLESIVIGKDVKIIGMDAFWKCTSLTNIVYKGSIKEFNTVTKISGWNYGVPATKVICADGVIEL